MCEVTDRAIDAFQDLLKRDCHHVHGLNGITIVLVRQAEIYTSGTSFIQVLFSGESGAGHYTLLYVTADSEIPVFYCSCRQNPSNDVKEMIKYLTPAPASASRLPYLQLYGQRQSNHQIFHFVLLSTDRSYNVFFGGGWIHVRLIG